MTKASETYELIEPFLKHDLEGLFRKTGSGRGQDVEDIFILLFDVSKEAIFEYSYSNAGLVSAHDASASGDLIYVPAGTLGVTAIFTVKEGVTLKGAGVYGTFMVATGNYGNLITLATSSCLEDMTITYTATNIATGKLIQLETNSNSQIVRRVHAYFYNASTSSAYCFHTGTNTAFSLIENCLFVCDGNGGERTGIYAATTSANVFIRFVYAYAHNNTASVNAYGISITVAVGGPIILIGCFGYGYAQNNATTGYGIYTTGTVELYACHGMGQSGTATAIGLEVANGAKAFSCYGEASSSGTQFGLINNAGYMYACSNKFIAGTSYGVGVWGTAYAVGCQFFGNTSDILLNVGCDFHVYACQYDGTSGAGTLTKDDGDVRLGAGTDNRITQWNGTGGLLEDSNLVGPVANLLNLTNAAANTTLAMNLAAGKTITFTATDNRSLTFSTSGHVPVCPGTEAANSLALFTAASTLDDIANGTGYLYNDGVGNYSYIPLAEAPATAINIDGTLATGTDVGAFVSPGDGTILAVYIRCKTLGTADSTIVDCNITRSGVYDHETIFTDQGNRPTLAWNDTDGYAKSGEPDIATLAEGDILTFDIDAIATGATDITIILAVKWASITAAPSDPEYIVASESGALPNSIVKDYMGDNYDPDVYPTSPDDMDDEFNGDHDLDLHWTKVNNPLPPDNFGSNGIGGFLWVGLTELGTDDFDNTVRLYQSPPASNHAWEIIAKVNVATTGIGGEGDEFAGVGLYLGNSVNDQFVCALYYTTDFLAATSYIFHVVSGLTDNGSGGFTTMSSARAQGIPAGQFVYLKLCKTTEEVYTNANTYTAYCSLNGIIWDQVGSISKTFTTACDECGLMFRRPKSQTGTPHGEALVDFFRKTL